MISQVYVIACDKCRKNMQILQGAHSVGGAFKAAKKLPWRRNGNNTVHTCPECMAKIIADAKKPRENDAVEVGNISKDGKK